MSYSGAIDIDSLDIDLDMDGDIDADVDIDGDVDASVSGIASVLSFFNIGDMPLMVFVSFYVIPFWMITLSVNHILGIESFVPGLTVLLPSLFGCLFLAKFMTIPVAKFYKKLKSETEAVENIVGRVCVAKLPISSERKGQGEIKVKGTSVLISAKTRDGQVIEKGESALIIEYMEEEQFYYVEAYQL